MLYTTHHACWDAKNRFGLPDEVPFDYASIAHCITGPASAPPAAPKPAAPAEKDILPPPSASAPQPKPQPESPRETVPEALLTPDLMALGVPEKLAALMSANNVTPEELQFVVGKRGYFPKDMPIRTTPPTLWRAALWLHGRRCSRWCWTTGTCLSDFFLLGFPDRGAGCRRQTERFTHYYFTIKENTYG